MIAKRIRIGRKYRRSSRLIGLMVKTLIAYVVDALAESLEKYAAVRALTGCITDNLHIDRNAGGREKVREIGQRNLAGTNTADLQADMAACAMQSTFADPIEHIVISWRELEVPTPAQVADAIDTILDELDARDLQCVFAVHHNTRFVHAHIVINRVCPKSHRLRQLGEGWEIDRLHQAVALVEAAQGWQAETDGVYAVDYEGVLRRRDNGRAAPRKGRDHAGERAERRLEQQAVPYIVDLRRIILASATWSELHAKLAEIGYLCLEKGSGAVVTRTGEPPLKASAIAKECSRPALERRLGSFVASATKPADDRARAHASHQIDIQLAHIAAELATTTRLLESQCEATITHTKKRLSRTAYAGAIAVAITAEFKYALKAIFALFRAEVKRLRVRRRYARVAVDLDSSSLLPIFILSGQSELHADAVAIMGYTIRPVTGGVAYQSRDDGVAFTDHRIFLMAAASADDVDIVAAMRLASARFGTISMTGSSAGCARAAALARQHDIDHVLVSQSERELNDQPTLPPAAGADVGEAPQIDYRGWFAISDDQFEALRTTLRAARVPQGSNVRHNLTLKLFELVIDDRTPAHVAELVRCLAPFLTQRAKFEAEAILAGKLAAIDLNRRQLSQQATAVTAAAAYLGVIKGKRTSAERVVEPQIAYKSSDSTFNEAPRADGFPTPSPIALPGQDDVHHRKRGRSMER